MISIKCGPPNANFMGNNKYNFTTIQVELCYKG